MEPMGILVEIPGFFRPDEVLSGDQQQPHISKNRSQKQLQKEYSSDLGSIGFGSSLHPFSNDS